MPKAPAYQRIKSAILTSIHQGKLHAGQALASEMALAKEFGVSRMTVNRALKELADEQVLLRVQGSGTFVAQKQFDHTFVEIRNIAKDIVRHNQAYKAVVLNKTILKASELGELTALFGNTNVYFVKIVHFANDTPLQLEERWVSANLVPDFINQDFETVNTSDYLINSVPLESGHYRIVAKNADENLAYALNITQGQAVLVLERTTLSQAKVVTYVKMSHAGEQYEFGGKL